MKHWVLYMCENGKVGSASCRFAHFPPTISDLKDMEEKLKRELCVSKCTIVSWEKLTEE